MAVVVVVQVVLLHAEPSAAALLSLLPVPSQQESVAIEHLLNVLVIEVLNWCYTGT